MKFYSVEEVEIFSKIAENNDTLKIFQNVIDLSKMEDNMMNFEFTAKWDSQTKTNVFNLSKMFQEHQPNYAYDFDHINYAIIAAILEGEFDLQTMLLKYQLFDEDTKIGLIVELVNRYNDLNADFEII